MLMKTILIHAQNPELSTAWASYLSNDGSAVFTSSNPLESAEILSTIKVDTAIISTNDPETFLLLGKVLLDKEDPVRVIAITEIRTSQLDFLLGGESFVVLAPPFTFSKLKGIVDIPLNALEEVSNAFVLQSR